MRVLFFGTDGVAARTLRVLHESMKLESLFPGAVTALEVVTPSPRLRRQRRKQFWEPTDVGVLAEDLGLGVVEVPGTVKRLRDWKCPDSLKNRFDVGVVVSFGYFLNKDWMYGVCEDGKFLNMHPSLLPRHRGPSPVVSAILAGDSETGVTVQKLHASKFDAGDVLWQERVELDGEERTKELTDRLADIGARGVLEVVAGMETYWENGVKQDESQATHCGKIDKSFGRVDVEKDSFVEIWRRWRALCDVVPVYFEWRDGKRLILREMRVAEVEVAKNGVFVDLAKKKVFWSVNGGVFELVKVQMEAKETMEAFKWARDSKITTL